MAGSLTVLGQSPQNTDRETKTLNLTAYAELLRSDVRAQKVAIITEVMGFTETENTAFWPIYREYDSEMAKLGDERVAMIAEYAQNYSTLTDAVAEKLAGKALDLEARRHAVKAKCYERVKAGEVPAPDVLLIDGGLGQINEVYAELEQLGFGSLKLVGVSKGPDRKPGQERLIVHGDAGAIIPGPDSQALRVVQRIRDEAHRFAITGHRKRRARRHNESVLETVPGLGPAKRRALLRHFGGMQGLLRAGVTDFEAVSGIGTTLARTLYDHLHPGA
jgi:excinuclease UvrABC nuclease subunit